MSYYISASQFAMALGEVLNRLLSEVINGNIKNEHNTLLTRAKEIITTND